MTIKTFIEENKDLIDIAVLRQLGCWVQGTANCSCYKKHMNNSERRLWILNDEGLYRYAKLMGVRI